MPRAARTRYNLPATVALAVLAFAADRIISAQQHTASPSPEDQPRLRVDVSLAMIPVTVTDLRGEPVTGLLRENFQLFEDGVKQPIVFLSGEDIPVSVCLVFDLSASMRDKMHTASPAMLSLLRSFDQPNDEACLIVFNERPRLAVPFTEDFHQIETALHRARTLGRTSLLDAIHLARRQMRSAKNRRKVILIISDGGDNHSRATRAEIQNEMREADLQVYAISVFHSESKTPASVAIEELNGPFLLNDIAVETGGRHVELTQVADLPATCAQLTRQLHNQYVLGYSPAVRDGRLHQIRITVNAGASQSLRVYHRRDLAIPAH